MCAAAGRVRNVVSSSRGRLRDELKDEKRGRWQAREGRTGGHHQPRPLRLSFLSPSPCPRPRTCSRACPHHAVSACRLSLSRFASPLPPCCARSPRHATLPPAPLPLLFTPHASTARTHTSHRPLLTLPLCSPATAAPTVGLPLAPPLLSSPLPSLLTTTVIPPSLSQPPLITFEPTSLPQQKS